MLDPVYSAEWNVENWESENRRIFGTSERPGRAISAECLAGQKRKQPHEVRKIRNDNAMNNSD